MMTRRSAVQALGLAPLPSFARPAAGPASPALAAAAARYWSARAAYMRAARDGYHERVHPLVAPPDDPAVPFYAAEHGLADALLDARPEVPVEQDEPAEFVACAAAVVGGHLLIAFGEVPADDRVADKKVMALPLSALEPAPWMS